MKNGKFRLRLMKFFQKHVGKMNLEEVTDPRDKKGRRWKMPAFLRATIVGIISGRKSLREVEQMTEELPMAARALLGISRRLPDTTLRDSLIKMSPDAIRELLHDMTYDAFRRKALEPEGLPCGVVAMDGKFTCTDIADENFTQHQSENSNGKFVEKLGTITSCLISSRAKVCLDAFPIPPATNEKGVFQAAFDDLLKAYGNHFEIITYDPGANSEANANYVDSKNIGYVFGLKADQKTLLEEAERLIGPESGEECTAETTDYYSGKTTRRRVWKSTEIAGFHGWKHLRMVVRVQSTIYSEKGGGIVSIEDRYFVTNLPAKGLTDKQWLWIREPQGMLIVQLLRRIAYNLMALFRSVTQRSDEKRRMPWRDLMYEFYHAFILLALDDLVFMAKRRGSIVRS